MKILIVTYTFPPAPGIGGRRWAKFSKELAKLGHEVFIIAAKSPSNERSGWTQDIRTGQAEVLYLPLYYPKVLINFPENLIGKLSYRIFLLAIRLLYKGNPYDKSLLWGRFAYKKARLLIEKEHIPNIIVSGGPFRHMYDLVQLKKDFPHLNFIADFRDPWTNNVHFFGYANMKAGRLGYEKKMELEVVRQADKVISVSQVMNDYFKTLVPDDQKGKFYEIQNGFDPEDLAGVQIGKHGEGKKVKGQAIRFVYTGSLYPGLEYIFHPFLQALRELKFERESLYAQLKFDFYGGTPEKYRDMVSKASLGDTVRFHPPVSLKEVYTLIGQSDVCMLFLNKDLNFSLSTKFYEYLLMGKSIWVCSVEGFTSQLVRENGLGYASSPDVLKQSLIEISTDYFENRLRRNPEFRVEGYAVRSLAEKVGKLLI